MILSRTLMFMLDCVDDVFPVCKKTEQGRQVMRPFCSTLVPLIQELEALKYYKTAQVICSFSGLLHGWLEAHSYKSRGGSYAQMGVTVCPCLNLCFCMSKSTVLFPLKYEKARAAVHENTNRLLSRHLNRCK
jgi:hypothetical protein